MLLHTQRIFVITAILFFQSYIFIIFQKPPEIGPQEGVINNKVRGLHGRASHHHLQFCFRANPGENLIQNAITSS